MSEAEKKYKELMTEKTALVKKIKEIDSDLEKHGADIIFEKHGVRIGSLVKRIPCWGLSKEQIEDVYRVTHVKIPIDIPSSELLPYKIDSDSHPWVKAVRQKKSGNFGTKTHELFSDYEVVVP